LSRELLREEEEYKYLFEVRKDEVASLTNVMSRHVMSGYTWRESEVKAS
jgi:hypothetical protein